MLNVDKIFTISLLENEHKRQSAQLELTKLKLTTEFFLAQRDQGNEVKGCFNSHVQTCQQALLADPTCQSLLVFEDDVKILSYQPKQIAKINWFIQQKKIKFDILFLGSILGKIWFCGLKHIVRARVAGAHAYILSSTGMEKLRQYRFNGIPIDHIYKQDFRCYAVYPMIAEQHPEEVLASDLNASRADNHVKDQAYWLDNYHKQKRVLWKNWHRSIRSLVYDSK